ncbi:hypothetical protein WA026_016491 [Henosepilachna vigintioctopunctata]|uniref:Uncharacterized protein n=1 Tax=Henosepilachna vigintioctopunctata TaxID=420089 RepID=A0AAW1UDA0_9CUCU
MAKYKGLLLSAERTILLKVMSGYRTVSIEAAQEMEQDEEVWRKLGTIPDTGTIIGFMLKEEND